MQGDQHNFSQNRDQMGSGYLPDHHISSFFSHNVDFQPSWDCPRNFIIFDRTNNHSQIMYNPGLNMGVPYFPDTTTLMQKELNDPRVMEEDLADIDALLSCEDEDEEEEYEEEEEEVSTARTEGNDTSETSDSCSSSWLGSTSCQKPKGSLGKHEKMRKMVKSLRGIVPGGNQHMNTADVLDEAVKYLRSLKVEAHKMGVGNLSG